MFLINVKDENRKNLRRNREEIQMKKKIGMALISLLALVGLGACKDNQAASENKDKKLQIVATFYPMYDFTKNIVGDAGEVSLLMPAGSEPHDYEPSAKDMAKITDADVFVYHNENMEAWVPSAVKSWKKESQMLSREQRTCFYCQEAKKSMTTAMKRASS